MDFLKVKSHLSKRPPESAYEYANLCNDGCRMFLSCRSSISTPKLEMQQKSGEAIRGRIAPMNTTATRFIPSGASLLERSGNRLHNVKGAFHHV
jgi:hypothetical protein